MNAQKPFTLLLQQQFPLLPCTLIRRNQTTEEVR
jgi:hypothetical protein